jgi:nucleotide-binding universal stress UspA family protein
MSTLWQVTRDDIDTPMIMKVPTVIDNDDPATIVGFEMEQMILPLIGGIHVPRFFARGQVGDQPFIVMERIAGESLLPKLDLAPLPIAEVIAIATRVADALDDLHRQQVLHLDIKPSNIMQRPSGEAVLIDFGLSHHDLMPDLLTEELRLPVGTGPYISPEQIKGVRSEPRSDLFSLGVLLYHLVTRQRPFGFPRSHRALRRRLWRDPVPPRAINPECPPWLQEIILRCVEPDPALRHPTAAQLAFDLKHPEGIALTARAERVRQDAFIVVLKRWYEIGAPAPREAVPIARSLARAPIVLAAIDLSSDVEALETALKRAIERVVRVTPGGRLACVNVMRTNRLAINMPLDAEGHNIHQSRLATLKRWAAGLDLGPAQVTFHVLEAADPASALLDYAKVNRVDHVLIGAEARFTQRRLLGSVASRIVAEAPCTVTVVRPPERPA